MRRRRAFLAAGNCAELADCLDVDSGDDDDTGDDDVPPDAFKCSDLGLSEREFVDAEDDAALYATAADFTVPTTNGDWNFKEHWTGCETYLFIQDRPRQTSGWPIPLWDRDVDTFLDRLPDNAHVFFVTIWPEEADREEALAAMMETVDAYLEKLTQDERDRWWHRIHYVTDAASALDGWLGEIMTNPSWGVGIDRFQRVRYIGSYADYSRYDSNKGWFAPNLAMAANEPVYYNFESDRDERMTAEGAEVVTLFDGDELSDPGWAGARGYAEVALPDDMDSFDALELDLYLGCVGTGEYGTCPAWDYIVELYLCDKDDPDTCDMEIGRWITTYHREGRWAHDISAMLPLLADGGTRRFAFYTQQPYEVRLDLRFYERAKGPRPVETTYLFSGGAFDANYNTDRDPVVVSIPEDAAKVELAVVISGHGQVSPGNCAEFCKTTHHFYVNGEENVVEFPEAGTNTGCMDQVADGAVPNQYGTWWYGRSGWCPGKEVPMRMIDVTAQVTPGGDATFEYEGLYGGDAYTGSGADIRLDSWVVVSK
ncbi:MAG: peptide-N-glycosidase F-related protein [Deltaproteobacteria bacterium]|nr:peptide-N-glycosidase F-related protein [Deltaproteobacteria bacterium]